MFNFAKLRKGNFNKKYPDLNQEDTQLYTQLIEYSFQSNFNLLESERRNFNDLYGNNIFSKMIELVIPSFSIPFPLNHLSSFFPLHFIPPCSHLFSFNYFFIIKILDNCFYNEYISNKDFCGIYRNLYFRYFPQLKRQMN